MTHPVLVTYDQAHKIEQAARKAARLYPGVVGEILSTEILSLGQFTWLGANSRAARLMRAVTEMEEGSDDHQN